MPNPTKTNSEQGKEWEVTLDPENTVMAQFQDFRTQIISEMLDQPGSAGIYQTSRFYSKLDDYVRKLLSQQQLEVVETVKEIVESKRKLEEPRSNIVRRSHIEVYNNALSDILQSLSTLNINK